MPRPPLEPFSDADMKQLETLAGVGLNRKQIAAAMSLSERTLLRKIKITKGGTGAIKRGRAIALSNVAKTLYQMAVNGKNPAATFFYLKTRGGSNWREKDRIEHTGTVQVSVADELRKARERAKRLPEPVAEE